MNNFSIRYLTILLSVFLCTAFVACSDDDDDNNFVDKIQKNKENGKIGKAIDLGLSVKWASWNVGATSPEEYGNHYAWGETENKDFYEWDTYKWCNGSENSITKYCSHKEYGKVDNLTTLEPQDDVAHVKWGGKWRMPTIKEFEELIKNCNWESVTIKGIRGFKVTGPNGNNIFLPEAGSKWENKRERDQLEYWTNERGYYSCYNAMMLWGGNDYDKVDIITAERHEGKSVRPVCE